MAPSVLIVMGSDSDFDQVAPAWKVLESLGLGFEVIVASAHRSPERVVTLLSKVARRPDVSGTILTMLAGAQLQAKSPMRASHSPQARSRRESGCFALGDSNEPLSLSPILRAQCLQSKVPRF